MIAAGGTLEPVIRAIESQSQFGILPDMATMITDLDTIKRLAAERRDEFEVLRYMLEIHDELSDETLDTLVDELAAPIIAAIECTQCANCCRSLDVYLTPGDAERLATGIDIPLSAIKDRYIDDASDVDEWGKFRAKPCAFLDGKLCSVYAHRPETCRTYPVFTPDFRWTLADTIEGAALCPIIYYVLDALTKNLDRLYK